MATIAGLNILGDPMGDRTKSIEISGDVISSIAIGDGATSRRLLAMPAMVNAHDHARPLSPTSFGAAGKPLETWILRLAAIPSTDPYLVAAAALGRAAQSGCASIMAHVTRLYGPMLVADEVGAYARAANDIGARVTFALFMRDRNPLVYGDEQGVLTTLSSDTRHHIETLFCSPMPSVREQIERVEALAAAHEGPLFNVQYGPSGVQWCSDDMLDAIAESSARTGRRVHMHLLETPYQRAWADRAYPQGVVRHLRDVGLLSPRLALAHCVHARPDELDMIAEAGATIVTNPSSNLHLRSGVAPIGEAMKRGCKVAIGIDASAFDEDDDALREMRLGHFLHGGWGFEENVSREKFLARIVANGRFANGAPGVGALGVGEPADILVLDLDRLDRDAIMPVDPLDLLFARANQSHIAKLYVAGRQVIDEGKLMGVDLEAIHAELRERLRAGLPSRARFLSDWPHLEPAVAAFYRSGGGCC